VQWSPELDGRGERLASKIPLAANSATEFMLKHLEMTLPLL